MYSSFMHSIRILIASIAFVISCISSADSSIYAEDVLHPLNGIAMSSSIDDVLSFLITAEENGYYVRHNVLSSRIGTLNCISLKQSRDSYFQTIIIMRRNQLYMLHILDLLPRNMAGDIEVGSSIETAKSIIESKCHDIEYLASGSIYAIYTEDTSEEYVLLISNDLNDNVLSITITRVGPWYWRYIYG